MAKKISQLTQATQVKSDDVTVIVQDGETKKLPLNMMVTKQDIENKKVAGLAKLDEIEATYENDTYTPTIAVKNKSSVKVGEGDGVDYSANVMDGPAKSAILKGQTLVNVALTQYMTPSNNASINGETITLDLSRQWSLVEFSKDNTLLIPNEVYTCILYDVVGDTTNVNFSIQNGSSTKLHLKDVGYKFKFTMGIGNDHTNRLCYVENLVATSGTVSFKMVLLKGDYTNVDIPYFTGMQSVKMPVLTTTGKNLFDVNKFKSIGIDEHGYYVPTKFVDSVDYVTLKLKPNTRYTVTGTYISDGKTSFVYRIENNGTYRNLNTDFDTDATGVVNIRIGSNNYDVSNARKVEKIMIVESTLKNIYEPFKSNTLSTPEDLELRGIGNVKDELNVATGELTQRIGEIVLDNPHPSHVWNMNADWSMGDVAVFWSSNIVKMTGNSILCDKFPSLNRNELVIDNVAVKEGIRDGVSSIQIFIAKNKLATPDVAGFKQWLSQNPLMVQYELATPITKTVDLMPSGTHPSTTPYCWKNGHIQLSSSGLLPNLEYSVVTSRAGQINQNATMIVKNDKRIFDLEILLAGGLVNTTYQALTLQNQVETGLSKVSLNSETEPDYLLYHMIMKLIEEKAYKLDDLAEKVSVFYLYEKLSDEQFETIYAALYPFAEDEIIEEPVVEELPEVVEDEVIM